MRGEKAMVTVSREALRQFKKGKIQCRICYKTSPHTVLISPYKGAFSAQITDFQSGNVFSRMVQQWFNSKAKSKAQVTALLQKLSHCHYSTQQIAKEFIKQEGPFLPQNSEKSKQEEIPNHWIHTINLFWCAVNICGLHKKQQPFLTCITALINLIHRKSK